MHRKTARWKQHNNATCCLEQIPKTAVVQPRTSRLKNHPSTKKNAYGTLKERIRKRCSSLDLYTGTVYISGGKREFIPFQRELFRK